MTSMVLSCSCWCGAGRGVVCTPERISQSGQGIARIYVVDGSGVHYMRARIAWEYAAWRAMLDGGRPRIAAPDHRTYWQVRGWR